jgi:hypothetical protein
MPSEIDYQNYLQLLEESKPYKDSIVWNYSNDFYQKKGILAWSETAQKPVPHRIGTNYQNAFKLACLLKEQIDDRKVKVLECGAGSAKFAKNFLYALKELEITNQVKLIISDFSKKNIDEIRASKLLEPFVENEHYELMLLDITKAEQLNDNSYEFIFLHYVLDALKLSILKKERGIFHELHVKTFLRQNHEADIFKNPFLLARIEFEDSYKSLSPSLNKKILDFYKSYYSDKADTDEIQFIDSAILSLEKLLPKLTKTGFLLSCDIDIGGDKRYVAVGNSLAHPIDSKLLQTYFKDYNSFVLKDRVLSRIVFSKADLTKLKDNFSELYEKDKSIHRLIELEDELAKKLDRKKLEELSMLAPYSAKTYQYWAMFYKANQDYTQAKLLEAKAKSMDFWQDI